METTMMNEDFHKPFLKSLVIIAVATIVFMISSNYVVKYLMQPYGQSHSFTNQKSYENTSSVE